MCRGFCPVNSVSYASGFQHQHFDYSMCVSLWRHIKILTCPELTPMPPCPSISSILYCTDFHFLKVYQDTWMLSSDPGQRSLVGFFFFLKLSHFIHKYVFTLTQAPYFNDAVITCHFSVILKKKKGNSSFY